MHLSAKTQLGAFHLRQSPGVTLTSRGGVARSATVFALIPFEGWLPVLGAWLGGLALWIMGVLPAVNREQKPVAMPGVHFQRWFGSALT